MNYSNLWYDEIRVGNKGGFLNYNLLGVWNDANCSYQHTEANPASERIKVVKAELDTSITSYVKEGGVSKKQKRATKAWQDTSKPKLLTPNKIHPKAGPRIDKHPPQKNKSASTRGTGRGSN